MCAADILTVSTEFDNFAHKPIQTSILETVESVYKPVAQSEQSDLE
jgi:hypothetical protein